MDANVGKEIFEEIFNAVDYPAWVVNFQGKIIKVNATFSRLLGFNKDVLLGEDIGKISSLKFIIPEIMLRKEVFKHGKVVQPCYFKVLRDGKEDLAFNIAGKRLKDGCKAVFYGVPVDVNIDGDIEECLRFYVQKITKAQEEERLRIARELHDSTTQSLIVMLQQIESFLRENMHLPMGSSRFLWGLREQIRDVLQEVRHFSMNLRPFILDDLGLISALEWLVDELKRNYCIKTSLTVKGPERVFAPEVELSIFRIIQEALSNIVKHAKATSAKVDIEFRKDNMKLSIMDDGVGIELPHSLQELLQDGKFGLAGLFERVQVLRGSVFVQPVDIDNTGTIIVVVIPYAGNIKD